MKDRDQHRHHRGFTVLEAMVAILLMTVIAGAVFQQIDYAQQRANAEQNKLDIFQETRDFMDQMTRDLHQAGYPNLHNFAPGQLTNGANDSRTGVGLVNINYNELWFEGDVDGTGVVSSVQYHLDTTGNGCPCLRRSQIPKVNGNPYTGQSAAAFQTEVQNVLNGTSASPIFYAYDTYNNPVTLPVDFNTNAATMATISTIKVVLTAQSPYADLKTGQRPSVTLASTVRINNCSQAAAGQTMSCQ